jgi:peptidoglycan/xylan/chitin deacetylase (PgdA/CDA1 family)
VRRRPPDGGAGERESDDRAGDRLTRAGGGRLAPLVAVTVAICGTAAGVTTPAEAAAGLPHGLRATLPAPPSHRDARESRSPLDITVASFGQTGPRFELRVRLAGALPVAALAAGGHDDALCLELDQRPPGRTQRICLRVSGAHRLSLVSSRLRADGSSAGSRTIRARVRRSGTNGLAASFAPTAAGLTHGRLIWRVTSVWSDDASCPATAGACADTVPDRGRFAVRVHRGYVTGCVPAGASQRRAGPRSRRRVALTFDDGPGPQTSQVLRFLRSQHLQATFFELGVQAARFPGLVRRTLADGHAIGNHTYDHKPVTSLTPQAQVAELRHTQAVIRAATHGYKPCLFRPPSGVIDAAAAARARHRAMLSILWDVDPRDWALPGTDAIVRRVLTDVRPGSIVLLHDAGGPRSETLAALPRIVAALRARHYAFVTVPDLLALRSAVEWD